MKDYKFIPEDVCANEITFSLEDNKIYNLNFKGGCNGNLSAISKLLEGKDIKETIILLKGNDCGGRGTSCTDQLTKALEKVMNENNL